MEHWNRCLNAAKLEYDEAERTWRRILKESAEGKGNGGEVDVEFLERVRENSRELEDVLEGMGVGLGLGGERDGD